MAGQLPSLATFVTTWVNQQIAVSRSVPQLFMSGAQGIGKSTATHGLRNHASHRIAVLSLDDVYLTKADRADLADVVHPLFVTRGPPGTHDLSLLSDTLGELRNASAASRTRVPVFDKANDDRAPLTDWPVFEGQPDAIVIEGWMMGVLPDVRAPSDDPINDVEQEDLDGAWRLYQEDQLQGPYAQLWDAAGSFFHIDAPDFSCVLSWRIQQEEHTLGLAAGTLPPERRAWVSRFIQHYERLTRRMLAGQKRPGRTVNVDNARQIIAA